MQPVPVVLHDGRDSHDEPVSAGVQERPQEEELVVIEIHIQQKHQVEEEVVKQV